MFTWTGANSRNSTNSLMLWAAVTLLATMHASETPLRIGDLHRERGGKKVRRRASRWEQGAAASFRVTCREEADVHTVRSGPMLAQGRGRVRSTSSGYHDG